MSRSQRGIADALTNPGSATVAAGNLKNSGESLPAVAPLPYLFRVNRGVLAVRVAGPVPPLLARN